MVIHVRAFGYRDDVAAPAQCHGINAMRMNHQVVSREKFKQLRPDWQCKKCAKALEKQEAWEAKKSIKEDVQSFKQFLDKPTPSVNSIAKRHGVSPEYIGAQLAKGIEVEKEHTSHEGVAREIALDHLGERPDYYERLKAVEVED